MCGIVYVRRKDGRPAAKSVIKRYQRQKNRGDRGFGYIAIENDTVVNYVRSKDERTIFDALRKEVAPEILFHHRWPTSTPNVQESAHPLYVESPKHLKHEYFVVHNGVIRNDDDLYKEHTKAGFTYSTELEKVYRTHDGIEYPWDLEFNDSESLAIDTALTLEGKQSEFKAEGAAAVIAFRVSGARVVERYVYRNTGNPLKVWSNKHLFTLTSEGEGEVLPATSVHYLQGDAVMPLPHLAPPSTYKYNPYYPSTTPPPKPAQHAHRAPPPALPSPVGSLDDYIEEELANATPIVEVIANGRPWIQRMTDSVLWQSYDAYIGIIKELEKQLARIDDSMEYTPSPELTAQAIAISNRLGACRKALADLEKEINERDGAVGGLMLT